jgi:hypothetical protein
MQAGSRAASSGLRLTTPAQTADRLPTEQWNPCLIAPEWIATALIHSAFFPLSLLFRELAGRLPKCCFNGIFCCQQCLVKAVASRCNRLFYGEFDKSRLTPFCSKIPFRLQSSRWRGNKSD